jgi:CTP:molybdopterin cytidylyltransferase MocA
VIIAGLVLAAGAGSRAGGPKALRSEPDGRSWVSIAAASLRDAGCSPVFVVLGAAADEAESLVPSWCHVIVNADWASGMSTSLRAGIGAAASLMDADGLLITLVDLPWQSAAESLATLALIEGRDPRAATARRIVDGAPAHPVYIGRDHWEAVSAHVSGDAGAGTYVAQLAADE